MKRWNESASYAGLVLASLALWIFLDQSGALDGLKNEALRWRYLVRGERESAAPVTFVDVDAASVSYMGDRPWDRQMFGIAAEAMLGAGGADVVGIDVIFSKFSSGSLLDIEAARSGNSYLGNIVKRRSDQLVLAAAYTGTYSSVADEHAELRLLREGHTDPELIPFPEAPSFPIIDFGVGRLGLANVDEALNKGAVPYWLPAFVETVGLRYSLHLMDGARSHMSDFLNDPQVMETEENYKLVDAEGWAPVVMPKTSEQRFLSLGVEMYLAFEGLGADAVERAGDRLLIRKEGEVLRELPLYRGQSIEANWLQGWNPEAGLTPHLSMHVVLRQANALAQAAKADDAEALAELEAWFRERFEGRVVFVGPVDATLKDLSPTPFNREPVPKVGLHANLFRTIHDEVFVGRCSRIADVMVMVSLTILTVALAIWSGRGRVFTRTASLVLPFAFIGLSFALFSQQNFILPMIAPLGASLTAALSVVVLRLGAEEWQRRRIKSLFGAYLSPQLVDEMVDSQRDPELGGTDAHITALFSDVEGFSAFSETMAPNELVPLMNEYLGAMTDVIQEEGGTLDKYIGDAIVTMFGMPIPVEDHAARACRAALRMQERHAQLREEWRASGRWPVGACDMRTRIGLNTGSAVIGNMGSRARFSYTMMGDSVNLAARCESGAKAYGVYTMVTSAVLDAARASGLAIEARQLDRIVVKGRSEPVEIFELRDASTDKEAFSNCRDLYEKGLEAYFAGDWSAAAARFEEAEAIEPLREFGPTTPSAVLLARCREFISTGGPESWDGVYRMRTK